MKTLLNILLIILLTIITIIGCFELFIAVEKISLPEEDITQTRYIAHRGLSSKYYQNTRDAFYYAGQTDFFYGIETDLFFTKDQKIVCSHDNNPFVDENVLIENLTLEEALTLPLSRTKGIVVENKEEYLCTFTDYLNICKESNKVPIIELKGTMTITQLSTILREIKTIFALDDVTIIAFSTTNVDRLYALEPTLNIQLLCSNPAKTFLYAKLGYNVSANYKVSYINKILPKNNKINAFWTLNDKNTIDTFVKNGCLYITTDYDFS